MLDIQKLLKRYSDKVFLISESKELTYGELCAKIGAIHFEFKKLNIRKNDRVAIISSNSEDYVLVLLALIFYGAIAVPINHHFSIDEILRILKNINCTHIFYDDNSSKLKSYSNKISSYFINLFTKVDINSSKQQIISPIHLDSDSTIILTSGSTGYPKGVVHTLGNHVYSALGSNLNISFGEGDRWLLSLPLFHVGGIAVLFRALMSGGAAVLPKSRNMLLMSLKINKISHMSLVPTQLFRLIQYLEQDTYNFNLKAVLIGGDRISYSLIKKSVKLNLPLYLSYGSTEMTSQITTTKCLMEVPDYISYGKPLKYSNVFISDENDILVQGKILFKGYLNNNDLDNSRDTDGWFKTGDKGRFDEEGGLIILGRKDNMFISAGENIHPEEIERCIEHDYNVIKAVVVPVKDSELGNIPVVFIQLVNNIKPYEKYFEQILEQQLARYKWPKYYFELTQNDNSIKINRKKLTELANKFIT